MDIHTPLSAHCGRSHSSKPSIATDPSELIVHIHPSKPKMGTNPRPNSGKNTPGNQIQVLICLIYHHTGPHPTTQYRYTPLRPNMAADPSEFGRCTTIKIQYRHTHNPQNHHRQDNLQNLTHIHTSQSPNEHPHPSELKTHTQTHTPLRIYTLQKPAETNTLLRPIWEYSTQNPAQADALQSQHTHPPHT